MTSLLFYVGLEVYVLVYNSKPHRYTLFFNKFDHVRCCPKQMTLLCYVPGEQLCGAL